MAPKVWLVVTALAIFSSLPALVRAGGTLTVAQPVSDVCSLLRTATAAKILGGAVETLTTDAPSMCEWRPVQGTGTRALWITVEFPSPDEIQRLKQLPDFGVPSLSATPVTGLATKAVWVRLRDPEYEPNVLIILTTGMKMMVYAARMDDAIAAATEALERSGQI
jgi:hypothetical protein